MVSIMRFWLCLPRCLKSERGMALVMAIGITTVLGIAGHDRHRLLDLGLAPSPPDAARGQSAFSLAEAGINNVMSVLNLPTNNALDPDTLPKCTNNNTKYSDATQPGRPPRPGCTRPSTAALSTTAAR